MTRNRPEDIEARRALEEGQRLDMAAASTRLGCLLMLGGLLCGGLTLILVGA